MSEKSHNTHKITTTGTNESSTGSVFQFGIYPETELDFATCMLITIGIDFKPVKLYLTG